MKNNKNFITTAIALVAALAVLILGVSGCDNGKQNDTNLTSKEESSLTTNQNSDAHDDLLIDIVDTERKNVKVTMNDGQSFTICVYPDVAPQSAQNFLNLVRDGFYDGLTFHRIIEGFMAQGGDPMGTGMGGSSQNIYGEFAINGYDNTLSHQRGVVSMARSQNYNSASSQFFICYDDASFLDGQYAAFGEVIEGMEVVDSFLSSGTDANDRPLKEVVIQSMIVEE